MTPCLCTGGFQADDWRYTTLDGAVVTAVRQKLEKGKIPIKVIFSRLQSFS